MSDLEHAKLQECLDIVEYICADVNEEYPVGCLRVRRLLREVLADEPEETMYLGANPGDKEPPQ